MGVDFGNYLTLLLVEVVRINIGLGLFNLIPVPPLDGSKVLTAVLPERLYFKYMRYEMYGQFVVILLLYLGVLNGPLSYVFGKTMSGMLNIATLILGLA